MLERRKPWSWWLPEVLVWTMLYVIGVRLEVVEMISAKRPFEVQLFDAA